MNRKKQHNSYHYVYNSSDYGSERVTYFERDRTTQKQKQITIINPLNL